MKEEEKKMELEEKTTEKTIRILVLHKMSDLRRDNEGQCKIRACITPSIREQITYQSSPNNKKNKNTNNGLTTNQQRWWRFPK